MQTKFYLHYDNIRYELKDDDLYNWDQIMCSYRRNNFDGVVRSFSSQFYFVNQAKEILLGLYLQDRHNAQAAISVHTLTDRWDWEEKFSCTLDFSTVSWEGEIFKINAIDNNSLAALINANKGTKYEFSIGEEISRDSIFKFDRVPMKESLTYGFTQGVYASGNSADIYVTFANGLLPWVGNKGKEISVNGTIDWQDDQTTDTDSYLFKAVKDIDVTLSFDLEWWTNNGALKVGLAIVILRNGMAVPTSGIESGNGGHFASLFNPDYHNQGTLSNIGELPDPSGIDESERDKSYSVINDIVWELKYNGVGYTWVRSNKTVKEYFVDRLNKTVSLSLKKGDVVKMTNSVDYNQPSATVRIINSSFIFSWTAKGNSENVDVFTPKKIATHLIRKIVNGAINPDIRISSYDGRLSDTYLIAADSLRGMSDAKFYSSFNEFCDWMSTVFGYIYYLGDPEPSKYKNIQVCGQIEGTPWMYIDEIFHGPVNIADIVYIPAHAKFLYHNESEGKCYSKWSGYEMYNDPVTGHPRTDTLFRINELSETDLYYFEEYEGSSLYPSLYDNPEEYIDKDTQTIYFVHRSEILNPSAEVKKIRNCRDVKYNVDSAVIYSSITAGYDKKDYDNKNGRGEFNFNNTYSTGCNATDKTLSLLSKYRADCYGMEFAVQKRGENTTDTKNDQDVFFVLCKSIDGELIADKSMPITNSLAGGVFNGAFSPMACIRANAGFISLQAEEMILKFASSTGNSEIEIDGESMSADITLNTPLATSGWIEFTTDEIDDIASVDDLIEVADENGVLYRGFLKEVDVKYTKTEAVKYKLIVKDIQR